MYVQLGTHSKQRVFGIEDEFVAKTIYEELKNDPRISRVLSLAQ